MNKDEKKIYLTFDDGPVPEVTPFVLDILRKENIKATFFFIGKNIAKNPHIYLQTMQEGHTIGNHTYTHLKGYKSTVLKYLGEIQSCNQLMHNLTEKHLGIDTDKETKYFRPPYGIMKRGQYKKIKKTHSIVLWDVLSGDYDLKTSPTKCLQNVKANVRNGSIIIFHDSEKAKEKMQYALPLFIKYAKEMGFEFGNFG